MTEPTAEEWAAEAKYQLGHSLRQCGCGFLVVEIDSINIDGIILQIFDNSFSQSFIVYISIKQLTEAHHPNLFDELALSVLRRREGVLRERDEERMIDRERMRLTTLDR